MFPKFWSAFILVALGQCLAKLGENTERDPEVKAPAGTFRGKTLTSFSGLQYAAFRGIPYALPPVGDKRFAKPEVFPRIKGVFDATDFGPICVHGGSLQGSGQEDCLYLNVYIPIKDEYLESSKRWGVCLFLSALSIYTSQRHESANEGDRTLKKVLVFIHGGGFILGSSNDYLPGDLVTRADVVVVTMNYRLGWLGFMRGNSDFLPGNQALWDQLLALQWVKDNIRAFRGDPDDVTLSGESAGSISATILSITPLAKSLFTKVLLMSGTAFAFPSPSYSSNDLIKRAASETGCEADSNSENIDETIACLRNLPAEELVIKHFDMNLILNLPSSGDELLPRSIPELIKDVDFLTAVEFFSRSYMVSTTKDDGYIRINSIVGNVDISTRESLVHDVAGLLNLPEPVADSLVMEYLKRFDDLEKAAIALCTDGFYVRRNLQFMDVFERHRHQEKSSRIKAFMMSFDHSAEFMPHAYMAHCIDLVYIFDLKPDEFITSVYPTVEVKGGFTNKDWKMKSDFIDFIKVFMDTGTPGENLTRELDGMTGVRPYISFSLQPSVGQDILGDRRRIWEELLPKWMEEHQAKDKEPKLEL